MSYPSELPDQSNIQAYYLAKDYDYSTGKWHDILDNHVTSATTSNRPTLTDDPVNSKFKYLAFTNSPNTKITLGSNLFSGNNSSNQNYTLFTVARRGKTVSSNGTFGSYHAEGRIIDATNTNALFGWWSNSEGVFYVNTSIDDIGSGGNRGYEKNWAICAIRRKQNVGDGQQNKCWSMGFKGGNGGPYPGSGASREPSTGYHITDKDNNTAVTGLRLNHNEYCDFHVGEILFYKTNLSDTDVETVIDYLASRYFGTNSEGSNGTGNITFGGSGGTVGPLDISLGITGWYDGYSYDNSNSKWTDKTGLGNDLSGTDITGTLTPSIYHTPAHLVSYRNNKKYMQKMFKYIAGSITSRINFPTGFLADTSYTLFHVARRDPNDTDLNGRIFDGGITEYILEAGAGGRNGTGGVQGTATVANGTSGNHDWPETGEGALLYESGNANYSGHKATTSFNNNLGTYTTRQGVISDVISGSNGWFELRFEFPTAKIITKYTLFSGRYQTFPDAYSPSDWELRGVLAGVTYDATDSTTYTLLDTQSGITNWVNGSGLASSESTASTATLGVNSFTIANNGSRTPYLHYILHITRADSQPTNHIYIGEVAYYSDGVTLYNLEAGAGALNGTGGLDGSASTDVGGGGWRSNSAPRAFNGSLINQLSPTNTASHDCWHSNSGTQINGTYTWSSQNNLQFEFPTSKYITRYKIWCTNIQYYTPKAWTLRGVKSGVNYSPSNGATYDVIDTRSSQTTWTQATANSDITNDIKRNEYYVANPGYYKQYVLNVTESKHDHFLIHQVAYYSNSNWYSGFSDASSGVTAHDLSYVNTTDRKYGNNWVVSVDRPNYYRSIGYSDFSSGYYDISSGSRTDNASPSSVPRLTINNGNTTSINSLDISYANGGMINRYEINNQVYYSHTFLSNGTFTVTQDISVDFLIVGGGGGGATRVGGGGGAGGMVVGTYQTLTPGTYNVVIGSGGAGAPGGNQQGHDGLGSSFNNFDASGGGGGGGNQLPGTSSDAANNEPWLSQGRARGGGSGGGARGANGTTNLTFAPTQQLTYSGTTNVTGYGNRGGYTSGTAGAGGGGAGGQGVDNTSSSAGSNGGPGLQNNFRTGSDIYYAGGGGGGAYNSNNNQGLGGVGGGGEGGRILSTPGWKGVTGTGGGGGSGFSNGGNGPGGAGGSGIVVIRYKINASDLSGCDWNVAEVFAYNKHLSGSEEDSLADYLKFKYLGTNQVSSGNPYIYQLTHDISAVDASNTQQMIKGLPPDISAQTSIIGWYIPESYNTATNPGFWKDYSGHDNDLSNCGTSPEFVDKDSSYNWISYIRGSKGVLGDDGSSYSDASGFIFPENLLPTDGTYTIIHVSRRVKDASGNATGRIFDSASNKNFYSGFVGSKSGVALHSVDVSASR